MSERIMLPKFRASFVNVLERNAKDKFSICMLFEKGSDLKDLKKLAEETARDKYGEKIPKKFKMPWTKGTEYDEDDYPDFQDKIVVNASNKFKVGVVDQDVNPIIDRDEFYSGCYARATVTAACYDVDGNKGVNLYLQNVQKLGEGEKMGGSFKAEDEFEKVESTDAVDVADSDFDI